MSIVVRYFAGVRDLAGCDHESIEIQSDEVSTELFLSLLAEKHPLLRGYVQRLHLAVNGEFAPANAVIRSGDEVDVLPPVAGGSAVAVAEVFDTPLSIDKAYVAVAHAGAGGIAIFIGTVRDNADGKSISRLDYESHRELAKKEMQRILIQIESELPGVRLVAHHRVGELSIGDLAVVVAASAPHRVDAFSACRFAIDRIKETVPIWKKEWDADGEAIWVNLEPRPRSS